jgi:hypothetical protein
MGTFDRYGQTVRATSHLAPTMIIYCMRLLYINRLPSVRHHVFPSRFIYSPSSHIKGDRVGSIIFTMAAVATTLFGSSIRYRDLYREVFDDNTYIFREDFSEVELLPDLILPDIVAAGVSWEEFCQFASNSNEDRIAYGARCERVVWMTPTVHIRMKCIRDPLIAYRLAFSLGTKALIPGTSTYRNRYLYLHVAESSDPAEATATCDFLVRLVAASDTSEVDISGELPLRVFFMVGENE